MSSPTTTSWSSLTPGAALGTTSKCSFARLFAHLSLTSTFIVVAAYLIAQTIVGLQNHSLIAYLLAMLTWSPSCLVMQPDDLHYEWDTPPTPLPPTVVFPQLKTNSNLFILYKHPRAKFSWLIYSTNSYSCDLLPALHLSLHSSQAREDRQKDCSLIMKTDNLRRACAGASYVLVFFRFSFTQCV